MKTISVFLTFFLTTICCGEIIQFSKLERNERVVCHYYRVACFCGTEREWMLVFEKKGNEIVAEVFELEPPIEVGNFEKKKKLGKIRIHERAEIEQLDEMIKFLQTNESQWQMGGTNEVAMFLNEKGKNKLIGNWDLYDIDDRDDHFITFRELVNAFETKS